MSRITLPKDSITSREPVSAVATDGERTIEEQAFLREAAYGLVTHMFAACKTVRLYEMNNRATVRSLAELQMTIERIVTADGRASLRLAEDFMYLNDLRISLDSQHAGPFEFLRDELGLRGAETVSFPARIQPQELGTFIKLLFETEPSEEALDELTSKMLSEGIGGIELSAVSDRQTELADIQHSNLRDDSNRVYFKTVALVGDILKRNEERQFLQVRKAKRLTQQMVDIIQTDESLLVGLASIKNFDAYTFAHSVNVCILAMLMGDRMRLARDDIARLGVAALFHDIGKTYIPSSILNSTGELDAKQWELMKYHTVFGVKELSRIKSVRDAIDPMFVALQHHVHFNGNGYPQRPGGWKLRLFSRIVTVADYYDAMTASRTYRKDPVTPDKALRFILEKSGEIFDPFIAKLFIQAMGLYPVGTIVELDTGEKGVVVKQNADPRHIHRPVVELIDEDHPDGPWPEADLTERLSEEYRFRRTVVRSVHDSNIRVDKAHAFLSHPPL